MRILRHLGYNGLGDEKDLLMAQKAGLRDQFLQRFTFGAAQAPWYHHAIKVFGPERCMFESNFPVDRLSLSYRTLWNGLKKIAKDYPESAQEALFRGTARKVYKL